MGGLNPHKSLVVTAETDADVRILGITLSDYPIEHTLVVRGIELLPLPQNPHALLQDCVGTVWLEDIAGATGAFGGGFIANGCDSLVLIRCSFADAFFNGPGAVSLQSSRTALQECEFTAGTGALYGLDLPGSETLISGGAVHGLDGYDALPGAPCIPATDGEAAVRMFLGGMLTLLVADLQGGAGGAGVDECPDAADAPAVLRYAGTVSRA